jgi:molecular chaperone DnaK
MPYIGIDFGITNSVVANFRDGQAEVVPNHEGQKWTPSIVTLRRDGTLAFGQEAKENFDEQRSIRSIKRILGTPERVPLVGQNLRTEQIAVLLFSLLKKNAEQVLGEAITKAVVTIPANSKGLARHATKLCAGAAGMQILTLINGPTAAAISYGLNAQDDQTVLVYDFGGGTLDVTILHIHHGLFEELSSKGIGKLGGDDIDAALATVVADTFQEKEGFDILNSPYKLQFMLAVERAKIKLSAEMATTVHWPGLGPGRNLDLQERIDRASFERVIMPLVVKSGTAIDEAMKVRGLRPKDIDRVLLVGGSSKIPLVRRFVREKLAGKEPESFSRVDPATCKGQGAAIVSAILQGSPALGNYAYSVKLEHSLCTPRVDQRTNRVFLDPIIKRGADIPCSLNKTYYPDTDPAERILITIYEGDVYDDPASPENVKLAEIPWEFKPPRSRQDAALDVAFEYGDDGILTVQIQDGYAGQKKRFAIQQAGEDQMNASQLIKMKEVNKGLINQMLELESTQEYKDGVEVLKKTEQGVIPRVENPEDRRELEDLCRQVRQAMGTGDRKKMDEAVAVLNDQMLKEINKGLVKQQLLKWKSTEQYKDAVKVVKTAEKQVIPRVENPEDRRELQQLCRQMRQAIGSGDRKKMEAILTVLDSRLLNYAYLL